jgi:hypothetical protein
MLSSPPRPKAPAVEPIRSDTLQEFCTFLHAHLNPDISADRWASAFRQDWGVTESNHGFAMRDSDGRLVGGIGAIYAERIIRGRPERFCNITSWCVLDEYRSHSMRLALALVSQPGYHFTDLTPTEVVAGSLKFLKFKLMDRRVTAMPALPSWTPGVRIVNDPDAIETALAPADAKVFRDHRHFPWLRQVAVGRPGAYCHIAFKASRMKRLPCADILYVSDPELFLRYRPAVSRYLLLHCHILSMRIESRLLPRLPKLSAQVNDYCLKVFRSETLLESDISNFYSEAASLPL